MDALSDIRDLVRAGRFREALERLDKGEASSNSSIPANVLRVELHVRTGRPDRTRALVDRLAKADLSFWQRSVCEQALALADWAIAGRTETALNHMQKALSLAFRSEDLERICWCQLELLKMLGEGLQPNELHPMLTQLRANVVKLGDPSVFAAMHIFVGQSEAQRGHCRSAAKHTELGLRLLEVKDNLWLRCFAENTRIANLIQQCDVEGGIAVVQRSLELAEAVGHLMTHTFLANLGNLHYRAGDFDEAIAALKESIAVVPSKGQRLNGVLDSLACVFMSQGRMADARRCLSQINDAVEGPQDWLLYCNRHSRLTFAEFLMREGQFAAAETIVDMTLELADQTGDRLLICSAHATRARLFWHLNRLDEFKTILSNAGSEIIDMPELFADYDRIVASALAFSDPAAGRLHYERALRIYSGLWNIPASIETARMWNEVGDRSSSQLGVTTTLSRSQVASNLLQNVAALMLHAGRPELLATGLVAIVADTGSVTAASAVSRADDGTTEILASFSDAAASRGGEPERTLAIGRARNRFVEVVLQPRDDLESLATLNALTLLLGTVRDLEQAHAEREERLALWPLEELPVDDEHAIVNGRMRELMTFARRVAMTTVSVLITGESGTGKEILARAIHGYSPRAQKLFIPFNCTAIPRDMLESQLFGHRRGAFTSADRDNPGLIRAAKEGTLFLDEIGELGLDLQPKLLRFLESGEICPLGESIPLTVDVRIVAATNRNLEDLVREGRFREDLFYRLNVIRLTIPPLRERRDEIPPLVYHFVMQAGAEFGKGHIRVAEETMEHLLLYSWPGNIRQLHNEIRRMVALADVDAVLKPSALSADIRRAAAKASPRTAGQVTVSLDEKLMPAISKIERELIRTALRAHDGQLEEAARALGISRKGLYLKRQRLGL